MYEYNIQSVLLALPYGNSIKRENINTVPIENEEGIFSVRELIRRRQVEGVNAAKDRFLQEELLNLWMLLIRTF